MNQRGFSMMEVMLVLGLVPLVAFATVYFNQQISKTSSFTNGSLNMIETHQQLQLQMANKTICDSNFASQVFSNTGYVNLSQLVDRSGQRTVYIGKMNDGMQVSAIYLRPDPTVWASYQAAKSSITSSGFAMKASLIIGFKRAKGAVGSSDTSIALPMPMLVGATNNIIGCAGVDTLTLEEALSKSCEQVGGTYNTTLGTCVLNSVCNFSDPNKPVSQKCLDQQIGNMRKQISNLLVQLKPTPPPSTKELPSVTDCINNADVSNNNLRMSPNRFTCSLTGGYNMSYDFELNKFIWSAGYGAHKEISDPATLEIIKARITELYNARIASGK